jgi:hypothetical protein
MGASYVLLPKDGQGYPFGVEAGTDAWIELHGAWRSRESAAR